MKISPNLFLILFSPLILAYAIIAGLYVCVRHLIFKLRIKAHGNIKSNRSREYAAKEKAVMESVGV